MVPPDETAPETADEMERPRRPRSRWQVAAIALAVVAGAGAIAFGLLKPAPDKTAPGKEVPDFALARLDGKGTISYDDLRGSPLVINFWASWCIPCKSEVPLFQEAWDTFEDEGVTILGVALKDAPQNARTFVRDHGVTYPVVVDPDETLAKAMNVTGLPETFFVDAEGNLRAIGGNTGAVVRGAISQDLLTDQIKEMLTVSG
jgi:cytochrome c biogenesis protein CcmG/thiol:disulfide interchange protein DsbE